MLVFCRLLLLVLLLLRFGFPETQFRMAPVNILENCVRDVVVMALLLAGKKLRNCRRCRRVLQMRWPLARRDRWAMRMHHFGFCENGEAEAEEKRRLASS